MKRITTLVILGVAVALFAGKFSACVNAAEKAVDKVAEKTADKSTDKSTDKASSEAAAVPADRVIVMYFHRTQRCPTCKRMGTYTEESVKEKFAKAMKEKKVEFHSIDFQDKKNEALTKGYKVTGPTLIVAKVSGNKIKEFKNLQEMWAKNGDKKAFYKYVQENVAAYTK